MKSTYAVSMEGGTAVALDPGQSRPYDYNFGNFFEFRATGGVFTLRSIRTKPPELYAIGIRPVPAGMLMITSPPVAFTLVPKSNATNSTPMVVPTNSVKPPRRPWERWYQRPHPAMEARACP